MVIGSSVLSLRRPGFAATGLLTRCRRRGNIANRVYEHLILAAPDLELPRSPSARFAGFDLLTVVVLLRGDR
jgi:hypothetical protein